MTDWRLIDSGLCAASFNMALDEALAMSVRKGFSPPTLRIYGWDCTALSIGAFQKTDGINIVYCRDMAIPVVRRLTGGRAALHGDELTYSFSARYESGFSGRLMDVYLKIGAAFYLCFRKLGLTCLIKEDIKKEAAIIRSPLCFESKSTGEISCSGQKIIGSAQKRWDDAFLQQGSIPFSSDSNKIACIFGDPDEHDQRRRTPWGLRELIPYIGAETVKKHLVSSFEETFNVGFIDSLPSQEELRIAERLASERYSDRALWPAEKPDSRCGNNRGRLTIK